MIVGRRQHLARQFASQGGRLAMTMRTPAVWSNKPIAFAKHWRMLPERCYATGSDLTLNNAFKFFNLDEGPPSSVSVSREDALKYLEQMLKIRRIETECGNLYKTKEIRGFCHLYIGQEAVAVGMRAAMRKQDSLITSYRCHGWTYLMGVTMEAMVGELLGFSRGCSRGKGGSMHMYAKNFYGGNGIVGGQVPLGTGVALAHKYRGDSGVCISIYGDGAANQGQVFESYNIACLLKLPAIFVCENNVYGMGTKADRSSCCTDYYTRGHYIPGIWVDGNQILAVRSATEFAIDYALNCGPIVIEAYTYRYMGHSMSDPGTSYRTREEVQGVRQKRDPIGSFQAQMIAMGLVKEEEIKAMTAKVRQEMTEVVKKAKADKEVPLAELAADVYAKPIEMKMRGIIDYNLNHITKVKFTEAPPKATPANEMKNPEPAAPKAGPQPAPKAGPQPAPKAGPQPAPKAGPQPAPKAASKPAPKAAPSPAPKKC